MSDLLGLPCVHGVDATICEECWATCPCVADGPRYSNLGPDHDGSPDYCDLCHDTGMVFVPQEPKD